MVMPQTRKSAVTVKTRSQGAAAKKILTAKKVTAKKAVAKKTVSKKTMAKPSSSAAAETQKKLKKQKVIRDSFTIPKPEYEHIARLKLQCINAGMAVKKSELIRAGLLALGRLGPNELVHAISALDTVKTGRPLSSIANGLSKDSKKGKKPKK
jgi:hypothetical protein